MNCQDCKYKRLREESALAMAERTIRRLWILLIIMIVLMAGMATGFFMYEAQYEDIETWEDTDVDIDALQMGEQNFVAGGNLTYGGTAGTDQADD